jgi:hypothetical protein
MKSPVGLDPQMGPTVLVGVAAPVLAVALVAPGLFTDTR